MAGQQSCCTCWRWWLSWLTSGPRAGRLFLSGGPEGLAGSHGNLDEAVEECVRPGRRKAGSRALGGVRQGWRAVDLRASHTLDSLFAPPNSQAGARSPGLWAWRKGLFKPYSNMGVMARALTELQRQRLEPFHQRLWDSGPEPTPSWDGPDKQVLEGGDEPT